MMLKVKMIIQNAVDLMLHCVLNSTSYLKNHFRKIKKVIDRAELKMYMFGLR